MAEDGGVIGTSNDLDSISIAHSGFVNNQATAGSGGAFYVTGGMVDVINDTFSGNQAITNGGAIYQFGGDLRLRHVTISEGSASAGDAVYVNGSVAVSVLEFANNVINGACDIDDPASVTSLGGNAEGPGDSCELGAGSDLVGQTQMQLGLQPLRVNYHATPTHELLPGSVARGQGEPAVCLDVEVDQLFLDRDQCNSGAVESEVIFKDSVESSKFEI
jgi:predicted outer membrane repeat protein